MLLLVLVGSEDRTLVDVDENPSAADIERPEVLTTDTVSKGLVVRLERVAIDVERASEAFVVDSVVFVVEEALLKRPPEEVSIDDRLRALAIPLESAVVV